MTVGLHEGSTGATQDVAVTGGAGGTTARLGDMRAQADVLTELADELETVLAVLARAELDPTILAAAVSPVTGFAVEAACARFFSRAVGADLRIQAIATALRGSAAAYEAADVLIAASFGFVVNTVSNVAGHVARTVVFHPVTVALVGAAVGRALVVGRGVALVWDHAKEAGVFDRIEDVVGIDVEELAAHGAESVWGLLAEGRDLLVRQAGAHSEVTGVVIEHALPGFVAGFAGIPPGLVYTPGDWGLIPRDSQTLTAFVLVGLSPFGFFGDQPLRRGSDYHGTVEVRPIMGGPPGARFDPVTGRAPDANAPKDVRELWERQWSQSRDLDNGQVRVEPIIGSDGRRRHIVYIPATTKNDLVAEEPTTDHTTNVETAAGHESAQHVAVKTAIEEAGIEPDEDVMLVGYSQGGLVAASLLADDDFRNRVNVTTAFTVGSPVTDFPPPEGVDMLSIEHAQDLVPDLDGGRNGDQPNWTTLTVDLDEAQQRDALAQKDEWTQDRIDAAMEGPLYAHGGDLYDNTITGLEAGKDPVLAAWVQRNPQFFAGRVGESRSFDAVRT